MSNERKPRLFYWEGGMDAWVPVVDSLELCEIGVCLEDLDPGEEQTVRFRRFDMTDAEMAALPEE